ncbi:GATA domain-containing protein [Cephalotus follicularis]|uniref:GATA domain-containing protein n=1 Tax=Cephalotus follicularis TaxID=3775 RepID=A0A1Q3C749_CEPFO|nr:GATA domain-containing protein [Cephalotus follicularis]
MLYQTHHPFFSQLHPFTSILPSAPSNSLSSSQSSIKEMECVEAALKTSFKKEMVAMKSSPQSFFEDIFAVNAQNGGVSGDDFFVDDLLDFSNEDGFVEEEEDDKDRHHQHPQEQQQEDHDSNQSTNFSAKEEFESIPTSELVVPADDLADLEWLSHFVEDSNSEYSAAYPTGKLPEEPRSFAPNRPKPEPEAPITEKPCFKTPVPAKARSKRRRTGGRVWSLGSPSFTESSSSTSSSSSSCPSSPWLIYTNAGSSLEPVQPVCWEKPPAKKYKKKSAVEAATAGGGSSVSVAQPPRRCSHCGVQKTPQWRTGPLGPKTLCNACGVRYKSGRLLPEYRPACSPTFSTELHSNHHRKVLEMRRKKESFGGAEPGLAPPPVVPSF